MFSNKTTACNLLCLLLMAALLVCQCTPFWHFGEEGEEASASINGYVWFPYEHQDLEKYLKTVNEDHVSNDAAVMPAFQLLFFGIFVILVIFKNEQSWISLLPVFSGALGVWGYLSKPIFQAGAVWPLHLVLCIAMLLMGIVTLIPRKKTKTA